MWCESRNIAPYLPVSTVVTGPVEATNAERDIHVAVGVSDDVDIGLSSTLPA
jgi:hypothetical protein